MASKEEQYVAFYQFLETLDCYLTTTNALENEVAQFKENPHREIAGFMLASSETIDVPKGFIRMLYCLEQDGNAYLDQQRCSFSANPSEFLNTGYFPLRYSFLEVLRFICFNTCFSGTGYFNAFFFNFSSIISSKSNPKLSAIM